MRQLNTAKPSTRDYLVLAVITLIAGLVRFIGLTRDSLWTDETFSGYASQFSTLGDLIDYIKIDVHPPGYFASLWGMSKLFGNSDMTLRAFSAIGGILLVPVAFRLGRQLYDTTTGLITAFFTALLIQGIYYSQEVRAYIWLALFSALSVSLLIDFMRSRLTGKVNYGCLVLFILACAANAYFHYFGLLFSALMIAGWLIHDLKAKQPVWHSLVGGFSVIALFSPWIPVLLGSTNKSTWIPKPTPKYVAEIANILYGPGFMLTGFALLVLAIGAFRLKQSGKLVLGSREKWLIAWIVVPLLVSVAISLVQKPIYTPRNMLIAFVAGAILLARAITGLSEKKQIQWGAAIGVIVVMFGLHVVKGDGYLLRPVKQDVRAAARYVVDHNKENLPVVTLGWDHDNFAYYFFGTPQTTNLVKVDETKVKEGGLPSVIDKDHFWIASAGVNIDMTTDLKRDYAIEETGGFKDARAYLLRRKP